jgi:hypothetical protein
MPAHEVDRFGVSLTRADIRHVPLGPVRGRWLWPIRDRRATTRSFSAPRPHYSGSGNWGSPEAGRGRGAPAHLEPTPLRHPTRPRHLFPGGRLHARAPSPTTGLSSRCVTATSQPKR